MADTPDTGDWHPRLRRLYDYWLALHPPEGGLPARRHFDPTEVPELLSCLWLLDVQRVPFRLRYRLVGMTIVRMIGREVTGHWLDEAHPHSAQPGFFTRFEKVVATGIPSRRKGPAMLFVDKDVRTVENLVLPFAGHGREVDLLMVCTVLYSVAGQEIR